MIENLGLIIPAFIAGLLTFLAPCTLPLVPGYLGFISGVAINDLEKDKSSKLKLKIFLNGLLYVIGFSLVFIALGTLFSVGGIAFAQYRVWLSRIGGVFVIIFGLYMMHVINLKKLSFLQSEHKLNITKHLKPGNPFSSFLFGATFAFGWTPCVGPVLASVLFLASSLETVGEGAFLLGIFSLGLAIPFLIIAATIGYAIHYIKRISRYLNIISIIGGVFLVFIGILLLTDRFAWWIGLFYETVAATGFDHILDYL